MPVTCPCVRHHCPAPAYLQRHHILPQSWGGKTEPSNLVAICGTTHDAVHDLLNAIVKAKQGRGKYPSSRRYPAYAWQLALRALRAWQEANGDRPPTVLTTSHPS